MTQFSDNSYLEQEESALDFGILLYDIMRGIRKYWWFLISLVVIGAVSGLIYSAVTYQPMYRCEATFTVTTQEAEDENYYYSFYYDKSTAAQMASTFPYILDSDLLLDMVKKDLGVDYLSGIPTASVVENANLFTISVKSAVPEDAFHILESVIKNYPAVSRYVIGETQLNMIDMPKIPTNPYNEAGMRDTAAKGASLGLMAGILFLLFYALNRKTIRKAEEIKEKLNVPSIGTIPNVVFKKRSGPIDETLSIQNERTGTAFRECIRSLSLQVTNRLSEENKKILMISATESGEGVSTISRNLALALAEQGKKVLSLDGHFSAEKLQQAIQNAEEDIDYILVDAPALKHFGEVAPVIEVCEAVLYVIGHDGVSLDKIMDGLEDLSRYDISLIGCVLNRAQGNLLGYGYGKYGRYGSYGYQQR